LLGGWLLGACAACHGASSRARPATTSAPARAPAAPDDQNSLPESLVNDEPSFDDEWTRDNGRPMPNVVGDRPSRGDGEPQLSPRCAALERKLAKGVRGLFDFACAISPSGEAWVSLARLDLPPDETTLIAKGSWQLVVERQGKLLSAPPQTFELFASHSGGACQTEPEACLEYGHYAGLLWPRGFWFVDVDGQAPHEAFVVSREEVNTDRAPEMSLTLWQLGAAKLQLHPLSLSSSIVGLADCNRDGLPELAINPYRVAGDEFELRFGLHARVSSERWTQLVELGKSQDPTYDSAQARSYAARLCPRAMHEPFRARGASWPSELHCAKLWCTDAAVLRAQLASACDEPSSAEARWACRANRRSLEHMIDTPLPCLLPATAAAELPSGCFDQAMANGD